MSWPEIAGWRTDSHAVSASGSGFQSVSKLQTASSCPPIHSSFLTFQVSESKFPNPE